jgi:enoyl-CoA hydratase
MDDSMGSGDLVEVFSQDGVAVLRLDDPDHRNALSVEMSEQLGAAVDRVVGLDVGAIVLTARPPVFCSGGSLDDLLNSAVPLKDRFRGFLALANSPVPTIAAIAGPVVGAGVNLALACDVVLTAPNARFDARFLDLGLHPGGGQLWRMQRAIGSQATAALVLFGETLDGMEAVRAGLAWRCVEPDQLESTALTLGRRAAGRPRPIVRRTVVTMRRSLEILEASAAFDLELEAQQWSMDQPFFTELVEARKRAIESDR